MERRGTMKNNYFLDDSGLLKAGTLFLMGSVVVAASNYLYHLFMGRMLGPNDYGILASLFAIIYLALFSNNVFNIIVSRYAAEFSSGKQIEHLKMLVNKSLRKVIFYGLFFLLAYIFLTPYIADFMKLNNTSGLIIVGITVYLSLISTVIVGSLNGMQKFGWQNIVNASYVLVKLFIAVLLVYLGFGVNGALLAIAAGSLVGIIIGFYQLRKILANVEARKFDSSRIYQYARPVAAASLLSMLIITTDQVLVKHYFLADEAGRYAAAGVIAKVVWFISVFFLPAMFPKVVDKITKKEDSSSLLRKAMVYTCILAAAGTLLYFLIPEFIIKIMYGSEYAGIAGYLWIFGMAMGFFALTQILVNYNLAHERSGFIWILLFGFVFEIFGILLWHAYIFDIVIVFLIANLLMLLFMIGYNWREVFAKNAE